MFLPSGGEAIREAAEWAAFMGTGAWLRWGIIPVRAAYEVGKRMGKIRQNAMHAARQATGRRRYLLPIQPRPTGCCKRPGVAPQQTRPPGAYRTPRRHRHK